MVPCPSAMEKKIGGGFASTKGAGHGFGLMRLDQTVARLGGYLTRNSEAGAFTTEVLIPRQGEKKTEA